MDEKIFVGLDVGTTKVAALVGRQSQDGRLEILAASSMASLGVSGGKVTKIDKTTTAISQVVKHCESQLNTRAKEVKLRVVNVGISGQHIIRTFTRQGSMMRANREEEITPADLDKLSGDMHKMVVEPGWDILHVYPRGYKVDYDPVVKDPVGMLGSKLEGIFTVVCVESEALKRLGKCVERAGLCTEQMIVDPMASSLSVLSDEEKEAGVCLVDVGGATSDVIIFREGMVRHVAIIPYGASLITSDLQQGCAIMEHQAELLKTSYGHALAEEVALNEVVSVAGIKDRPSKEFSIRSIASIIQCRMEEIIEMVDEELIRSGHAKALAAGIVVTGGGAKLRNLQALFEYVTGCGTRIGYPNERVSMPAPKELQAPEYATAVGLILAGMQADGSERREADLLMHGRREESFLQKIIHRTKGIFLEDMDDKV